MGEAKIATNDGKKRRRCYLPHNKPVKRKGPIPLRPGVQGFFITCDGGRERQASHEALNVIDSFLEELIDGKEPKTDVAVIPEKPLNKKITFAYSDSSESGEDDEDDNDNKTEGEEENKSEIPAKDEVNNESPKDGSSDHAKKDDQEHEVPSEKTAEEDKEVSKQQEDSKNKESEEPPAKKQCFDNEVLESKNHVPDKKAKSVDQLIEDELKELGNKSKRRFSKLDTGCNGVVFIQMRRSQGDPSPTDIVQHMMESSARTKKHISRFLLRVLPAEVSCYASGEEISRSMKPLVERYFPVDAETPVKFAVQYDARANSGIDRMKIIDAVAKSVPGPHKVDLKNPEKTIVVQIIKTVCLIGVVDKYKELAKYNLRQLTSSNP